MISRAISLASSVLPKATKTWAKPTIARITRLSLAGLGEAKISLKLAGAVQAEWDRLGADIHVRFWDALLDRYLGRAKQSLGMQVSEDEWKKGRQLSFEDAVKTALEVGAT